MKWSGVLSCLEIKTQFKVQENYIRKFLKLAKTQKRPKCPSKDEWIKQMCDTHTHTQTHTHTHTMEYYSAIKKDEILPLVTTWMGLEGITLSEVSQTEKDKYCIISLICGI